MTTYIVTVGYPLTSEAYDKIKGEEERKLRQVEEKFETQIIEMERKQEVLGIKKYRINLIP